MSKKTFVMPNDLSELCRVCLQLPEESQYLDLTTIYDEEDNLSYGECFTICTQIDLSAGEGVPHHLCKSCGLELQMSYDFHKKIEESKRVIEQYQLQNEEQKANAIKILKSSGHSNKSTLEQLEEVQIICDKFEESYQEEELPVTPQEPEEDCEMKQDNDPGFISNIEIDDEVNDEMDIINKMCHDEVIKQQETPPYEENVSAKEINENINQDHLEMEDYQNLEALEEEETETIQINCGEKTIPVQITKYTLDSGDNVEFLEYTEYYNEEDERDAHKEGEAEEEETNEENIEHLKWQENVVTVANKEHLPIKDEYEEQEEEEVDESVFALSQCKNNDNEITLNELSQDKTFEGEEEGEEENEDDLNTKATKRKTNTNNNNHVSRKRHVGSYSCDFCQRVYPNYSRMKTHRRCHEEDRPKFFCSHCGRMYATKQARDCHVQTAHEKSGFTCSICNKVFAIRKSLEIHIRYHTGDFPFACKLCDKKFAQVCHLNTHTNVKHNQIRFSCDYPNCDKTFTSSSSLRNHEYTHGVMPFECEYCQQGYPAKSKLRIHIQRKHSIDMSHDQLEKMRKFHVIRSKVNLVQFVDSL